MSKWSVGVKIGDFTITRIEEGRTYYICGCGREKSTRRDLTGRLKGVCVCNKTDFLNPGDTCGEWTLIGVVGKTRNYKIWECRCSCGNVKELASSNIIKGDTKSCGCSKSVVKKVDIAQIILDYQNGLGISNIAENFNSSFTSIKGILIANNIKLRGGFKLFKQDAKENISNDYKDGMGFSDIMKKYSTSRRCINKIIKELGVTKRTKSESGRLFKVNEDTFYNLNNDAMYWLGMIGSDGNVYKDKFNMCLHSKDAGHLEKLLSFMKSEHKVYFRGNTATISISSKRIADSLARFNIIPNKSLMYKPTEYLANSAHFWRGMIDGDGCININKNGGLSIGLCSGSIECIEMFEKWVKSHCSTTAKIHKYSCYYFTVGGRFAKKIINELYGKPHNYSLDRKYELAKPYIDALHSHA